MNILVISDERSKSLYEYFEASKLAGIDLILSCGDLPPQYLSFLATFTTAPVLYVHGNHDRCYDQTPPDGCICVDDDIYTFQGVRILGLGGCMKYRNETYHFTEKEMRWRVRKLWFKLRRAGGFDILLTHSPGYQLGDDTDLPHRGFKVFIELLDKYKPKYMIHGHVHLNYGNKKRILQYKDVTVINGFEQYRFEYESGQPLGW